MLKHTTTFGVRRSICDRYELKREIKVETIPYGEIRVKQGSGYNVLKYKAEYEDIADAAKRTGVTFQDAQDAITRRQ
jgi:uncharacterized protein (DUF111 family)